MTDREKPDSDDHSSKDGDGEHPKALVNAMEQEEVVERAGGSARVIHEVVRLEGERELDRPWTGLMFSGLVAGIGISASAFVEAVILAGVGDRPWGHLVAAFGYCTGFVIVVMGSMQLFTESTVTAVLPLATKPSVGKLAQMLRLWGIVFVSNMAGTAFMAWLIETHTVLEPDVQRALLQISHELADHSFGDLVMLGIPAGFLVGCIPWILPNAKGSEFWVIVMLTWMIAIGGLAHVVAGSVEAWTLVLAGEMGFGQAIGQVIAPALIGNILGGTGLFAVLAHGQVHGELGEEVERRHRDGRKLRHREH